MTIVDAFNFGASFASIILAILSAGLSIYFFVQTKTTEQNVSNSLAKIETQTQALQKLSGKYMDKLTTAVIDNRPDPFDLPHYELLSIIRQQTDTISAQLFVPPKTETNEQLPTEILNMYIAVYYYSALTNYWSQLLLPDAREFDENQEFHPLVKRAVQASAADFEAFANVLENADQARVRSASLYHLVKETQALWRDQVRTVDQVYEERAKTGNG